MVTFLHRLLWFFLLFPAALFLYDLVAGWTLEARLKIRSIGEFWAGLDKGSQMAFLDWLVPLTGEPLAQQILSLPAALVLYAFALALAPFYLYAAARERKRWGSGFRA